jgi:amidohydrolase
MIEKIKKKSAEIFNEIVDIRRCIHKNPELSYQEKETSEYIEKKLAEYGIEYISGFVKYGILGIIKGKNAGKTIALRADIDALPIQEKNIDEFSSKNDGVMHACGHDVHLASLLGTAKILNNIKNEFNGTVLLVFQPAEEKLPGGAKLMMEEGVFNKYIPDIVIGQHVLPDMKVGNVGFKSGMYMASTDEIYLTIKGKGGHAAMPHELVDTVLIASQIIVSLQQIVSRKANASIPSVLSFGKFIANGATNIIPDEVKIEGTFRTMNEEWRKNAHKEITKIAQQTAQLMGGTCDVNIVGGYPFLKNDVDVTEKAINFAKQFLGEENVENMEIRMTAEDFSYFSQKYPSTFYRLGTMNSNSSEIFPLHSSHFKVDENAMKNSTGLMAWIAFSFLK